MSTPISNYEEKSQMYASQLLFDLKVIAQNFILPCEVKCSQESYWVWDMIFFRGKVYQIELTPCASL
jgi:hypothetical protein